MPGGVDRYRFSATRGQQLVIAASARTLIPYLADAVPGWFEAVLTIYDAKGKELASDERFRFKPDPVIHFEVPRDGEYTVEIHDSIFRGREDFVYRLAIGELPFVTGIFPLGGRLGEKTTVALTGWNLPEKTLTHDNSEVPGITSLTGKFFNAVPFAVDDLPECFARGTKPFRRNGAGRGAAGHHQRPHQPAGRTRRVQICRPRRAADRRGSFCAPAGFAAGFIFAADGCGRKTARVQRRF